jgi:glycosyltransferase involved in cell wall biosynthesis
MVQTKTRRGRNVINKMNSKKKILLFANTFWYIYKFRSSLIARLVKEGYDPIACGPDGDEYQAKIKSRTIAFKLDRHSISLTKELMSYIQIKRIILRENPCFVLTFTPKLNIYASFASSLAGVHFIVNISGMGKSIGGSKLIEQLVLYAYRVSLQRATHVLFQNDQDLHYFLTHRIVHGAYSRIYGSGVDLDFYKPATIAGQNGRRIFLLASRLIKEKGVKEYLDAARRIVAKNNTKAVFLCCGAFEDLDVKEAIENSARSGVIRYLGLVDNMKPILERADCVVLPTYYNEGIPRILIEATAMGRIVITTPLSGCKDVVTNGENGFFVPPRDSEALERAITMICALNDAEIERMGNLGMELAQQRFDESVILNKYIKVINSMQ